MFFNNGPLELQNTLQGYLWTASFSDAKTLLDYPEILLIRLHFSFAHCIDYIKEKTEVAASHLLTFIRLDHRIDSTLVRRLYTHVLSPFVMVVKFRFF